MAETDYNKILLEAIDAIVVSRISEVNFDRTIVATIVDASKAKDGEYVLSDGSVQFTVRNGSDKYKENDRVNVLIPSNDFSSTEKTILGKTSANVNDIPVTYVSPLEKIVSMETNYAAGLKGGITANSETEIFQLTNAEWIKVNESTLGYDTLCVSARFKTLLNDYDIRQGHYGLLVQLKTKNGYIHALTLDSAKDMFGNPYGYSMYLTQEQTYHLNLQDNIVGIKIDLYQMKDFKYNDGVNSELQVLPVMPYSNILVDNINVSFGYNAEQVEDNTVKISTADGLTYDNIKDALVTKKLTLTWYNKDENNKYLGFSDGHFAGQDKDNPLYEIKWYHSQNNGEWALLSDFNDAVIADIEINLRWAINEYKAIVTYDGNEYSSNILSFKAETGYDSNIHDQLNMELELRNGKDSLDSYPFYGADSAVINPGDASKNREIELVYSGALGSKLESDILNGATVYFYIPTISTMLNLPFGSEDEELKKESDLEGYVLYQKEFSSYGEDNKQQLKTFRYRVKEFYNPLFNNNTVILKVIDKNGFEYSAKKTFSFSSYGTSGTDYTLVIEDPINKKATLYDADYKVIKTEFENKDWSYWPSSIGTGTPTAAAGYAVRKLSTTVKWVGKTVTLEAIKGIPWYPENSNYYYQGPTTITYDSAGVNPRYYTGDIGLYDKSTSKLITGLTWVLRYYPKNKLIKDPQTSISVQGYPQLLIDESGTKAPKLKAPNMYFDQDYYLVLVANNSNGQAQWRQPLIILQNAYLSNLLNSWNGALSVDQGNNTILSAMIGAGSKDSDNHFSGIVMGDLKKLDTNGGILNSEHGLLGFHAGVQSFGFRTNGTAFIGKSGAGRIQFDGTAGIIASDGWINPNDGSIRADNDTSATGLKIDLKNGTLISKQFSIDTSGNAKFKGDITGASGNFTGDITGASGTLIGDLKAGDFSVTKDGGVNFKNIFQVKTDGTIIFGSPNDEKNRLVYSGGTLTIPNLEVNTISANQITSGNIGNNANITIGGIKINSSSIFSGNLGGATLVELILVKSHSVGASTVATNHIKISDWGKPSAWMNTYYKIVAPGSINFQSNTNSIEYYILNTLPNGNGDYAVEYSRVYPGISHTINMTNYVGKYLLLNYAPSVRFSITIPNDAMGFQLTSNGDLYISNAHIAGNINANKGTIGQWIISKEGLSSDEDNWSETHIPYDREIVNITPNYLNYKIYDSHDGAMYNLTAHWSDVINAAWQYNAVYSGESDYNIKNSIADIDEYNILFDNLKPCKYKYNHGTSDRYHTGFIAQEVVKAIENANLTTKDFAGVIHLEEPNRNGCEWLLRRDEFVALNTWQIQKLKSRVLELENKLAVLEKKE